ncbi:hypothetical protein MB02_11765 [Croceicoccus estronivorus]|uniref:LysR family transcriptional regulator n=1 Tax=Croceicoccus estronivorus TaxID=1172626 RepID=UPI00082CD3AB|nr:LysR family transcriptional regulator [Croceicoccus estronivorus]OCC23308.1 hypothetical protein MB02_11765 [Croceicoccus estronivorus]
MFDWDDLRYYLVAAQAGTITAAADILGVSRMTVTRRVESLERSLNLTLHERTAWGPGSTDAGRLVLACARDVETRVAELMQALAIETSNNSHVRLSIPAEIDVDIVDISNAISQQIPLIKLEFVRSSRPDEDLRQRRSLVGLCVSDELPAHLHGRAIGSLIFTPYRSAEYVTAPDDGDCWIGYGRDLDHCLPAQWMLSHVDASRLALRVNWADDLLEAVRRGTGIGYLQENARGVADLVPVDAGPKFHCKLWLCMHEDVPPSPMLRMFLALVRAYFEKSISMPR